MLAAIGQSRESVYLVPLCAARPITGQVPRELEEKLGEILRHHIALAAPTHLVLLGQATSRAVLGTDADKKPEGLTPFNYSGGQSAVVAIRHPRFLLNKSAAKADAWKDLQLLIGGKACECAYPAGRLRIDRADDGPCLGRPQPVELRAP
ncbi:hypothetical protein LRS12_15950 [Sphingomonas sp. J344]|uniref:uracil-DNA glycosylase family protein n=1 Tax=Sphingomonas sp. J344 TaxID=2898434 RepID=UPI002151E237|nr:uracil-DNA glycosylase family protein [Sphingomonas sp. J344]MCR5872069.1 hypothetical protein [Sphingomonas sp. J344]